MGYKEQELLYEIMSNTLADSVTPKIPGEFIKSVMKQDEKKAKIIKDITSDDAKKMRPPNYYI